MTEQAYLDMLSNIMENGVVKTDRTGTGTRSLFGNQLRFDLSEGFPLITTKRIHFKSVVVELLWFLSGSTNIKYLVDNDVHIWDDWVAKHFNKLIRAETGTDSEQELANEIAEANVEDGIWKTINPTAREFGEFIKTNSQDISNIYGYIGPCYGYQWRRWPMRHGTNEYADIPYIDQITQSIEMLKKSPDSRRNIVSAWNVADIEAMAVSGLPPCHFAFQLNTRPINNIQRLVEFNAHTQEYVERYNRKYGTTISIVEIHSVINNKQMPAQAIANLDILEIPNRKLDLNCNIRSWDTFLGGPFNIASYALLIHLYAKQVNMIPGELIISSGDTHIYSNHEAAVKEQLSREPFKFPELMPLPDRDSIFDYKLEDIQLANYQSHEKISAPIAV